MRRRSSKEKCAVRTRCEKITGNKNAHAGIFRRGRLMFLSAPVLVLESLESGLP